MQIVKRLVVWFAETSSEALLIGVVLICLSGDNWHAYGRDLAVSFVWISLMFFSTGYLLTTGIARAVWQPQQTGLNSIVATALFYIHFEILNHAARGIFDPPERVVVRIAGGCIVLACTFGGTLLLRRWTPATNKQSEPQL
jgi:hypothetical protein